MRRWIPVSLLVSISLTSGVIHADPVSGYSEGWDVDGSLAGWQPNTTMTNIRQENGGGNPNGFLRTDGTVSASFDVGATTRIPELTGDYGGAIHTISVDLIFISGNFDNAWLRFRYRSSAHNGWVLPLTSAFDNEWTTFSIVFDPTWTDQEARSFGWIPDNERSPTAKPPPSWRATMSDVFHTEVRISGEGALVAGIDNFSLESEEQRNAGLTCDNHMSQFIFTSGQKVIADSVRVVNRGDSQRVEFKYWTVWPDGATSPRYTSSGRGEFVPSGFDREYGPVKLLTVRSDTPVGTYEYNCRVLDPGTGETLHLDINPFEVQ